jgi:predicted acyltransferase
MNLPRDYTGLRMATRVLERTAASTRLVSLDVLRGITMAAMVIVNNPGDWGNVYAPLLHAEWNGWTPTDLIFPFFLFIVGVSITLSRKSTSWGSIVRRSAIIFALGLFLAGYPRFDVSTWRIPGVLARIAVCYLFAASAYKLIVTPSGRSTGPDWFRPAVILTTLALSLCVVYWLVMTLVPAPGGVAGDLSPEGNVGAWLDRTLMSGHLWKPRWDPEGLLSTMPAIGTALLGIVAGLWIGSPETPERKVTGLVIAGIAGIAAGYLWNTVFPINKNLWTSSFVLFTAGAASLLLAICYWSIDVKGWRGWTRPFVILGSNAITLYVVSGLLAETLGLIQVTGPDGRETSLGNYLYVTLLVPIASPKNASLMYAFANLAVLFALLAWMYRRRIFLRV